MDLIVPHLVRRYSIPVSWHKKAGNQPGKQRWGGILKIKGLYQKNDRFFEHAEGTRRCAIRHCPIIHPVCKFTENTYHAHSYKYFTRPPSSLYTPNVIPATEAQVTLSQQPQHTFARHQLFCAYFFVASAPAGQQKVQ
jgi:hypothetical protein